MQSNLPTRIMAWASISHHDHKTGPLIIADIAPVQPLPISIFEAEVFAPNFFALAAREDVESRAQQTEHNSRATLMTESHRKT